MTNEKTLIERLEHEIANPDTSGAPYVNDPDLLAECLADIKHWQQAYIRLAERSSVESKVVQDVERWQCELKAAGWKEERFDLWRSPGGMLYRGPYKAWQVMMGHV